MSKFTREVTPEEIAILGPLWETRLTQIIDSAISGITTTGTSGKLLALMSDTSPMHVMDIRNAYNAVYGKDCVSFNYVRSLVSRLCQQGFIKRTGHGRYVREYKP